MSPAQDMTVGPISSKLIHFAVPLMLTSLLMQLYMWTDSLIVGNVVGEGALAAIGATGAVSGILMTLLTGFSVGVSILVAQLYGEGEREGIGDILALFAAIFAALGLLVAFLGFFFIEPLLQLLGTPADIFAASTTYLQITMVGLPFMAVYNIYSAVLRGSGDSRTPLLAIALSCAVSVLLNLLFVAYLGLGVQGAALTTSFAQAGMTLFLISYCNRKYPQLRLSISRCRAGSSYIRQGLRLGVPTAAQSIVRSLGSMMLARVLNSFGSLTVAAVTTAYRIDSLGLLPVISLGSGVTTFAAQNTGAKLPERGRAGLKTGLLLGGSIALGISLCVYLFGEALLGIFGISAAAIAIGQGMLLRLALFYPLFGVSTALAGYLQGKGHVTFISVVSILALAIRVAASFLLAPYWGTAVIAYAEVMGWGFTGVACLWKYRQSG